MADELSFLDAIRAQPEDDAVRLIFADWLEEHGQQARAEFIRLQCRLADIDEFAPDRPDLLDREWGNCSRFTASAGSPPRRLCWPTASATSCRVSSRLFRPHQRACHRLAGACAREVVSQAYPLEERASPTAAGCWARSSGSRG